MEPVDGYINVEESLKKTHRTIEPNKPAESDEEQHDVIPGRSNNNQEVDFFTEKTDSSSWAEGDESKPNEDYINVNELFKKTDRAVRNMHLKSRNRNVPEALVEEIVEEKPTCSNALQVDATMPDLSTVETECEDTWDLFDSGTENVQEKPSYYDDLLVDPITGHLVLRPASTPREMQIEEDYRKLSELFKKQHRALEKVLLKKINRYVPHSSDEESDEEMPGGSNNNQE